MPTRSMWQGQALHLGGLVVSTGLVTAIKLYMLDKREGSSFLPTAHNNDAEIINMLFYSILAIRVAHHVVMTCIWRVQLHAPDSSLSLSALCGSRKRGLIVAEIIDVGYVFLAGNALLVVAALDRGSLHQISTWSVMVGGVLCFIGVCTIVSAVLEVGPKGLAGADHFYAAEHRARQPITRGVYGLLAHPLYTTGPLLEWGVAVTAGSWVCLLLAASAHLAALGFLYGTEIPDMRTIYGEDKKNM